MISNASRRDFGFRLGNIKTSVGIPDVRYTTYSRDSRSQLVVKIPYGIAEARKSAVMAFHVDLVNTTGAKKPTREPKDTLYNSNFTKRLLHP